MISRIAKLQFINSFIISIFQMSHMVLYILRQDKVPIKVVTQYTKEDIKMEAKTRTNSKDELRTRDIICIIYTDIIHKYRG